MLTGLACLCRPCHLAGPAHAAATARFSTQEGEIPRETDCLLEGNGFELPVPRPISNGFEALSEDGLALPGAATRSTAARRGGRQDRGARRGERSQEGRLPGRRGRNDSDREPANASVLRTGLKRARRSCAPRGGLLLRFRNVTDDNFRLLAANGRLVLLLDGWNELDGATQRRLRNELARLRREEPLLQIVISTRRAALDVPVAEPTIELDGLSENQQI